MWFRVVRRRRVGGRVARVHAVRLVDVAASVWSLDGLAGDMLFAWLCVGLSVWPLDGLAGGTLFAWLCVGSSVWPSDGLAGGMLFAWLCVGWNFSVPVVGL